MEQVVWKRLAEVAEIQDGRSAAGGAIGVPLVSGSSLPEALAGIGNFPDFELTLWASGEYTFSKPLYDDLSPS